MTIRFHASLNSNVSLCAPYRIPSWTNFPLEIRYSVHLVFHVTREWYPPDLDLGPGDPTVFGNLEPAKVVVDAVVEAVRAIKFNGYAPSTGKMA